MATASEIDQIPLPDSEPRDAQERALNFSLYGRLYALPIKDGKGEVFKNNSANPIYVHLFNDAYGRKKEERPVKGFSNWMAFLSFETPVSFISYCFDDKGRGIKVRTRKRQDSSPNPIFSRIDSEDYQDVNDALRLMESGKFKVATREI